MKKNVFLLLLMLLPLANVQAQIINKSNKDKIGKDIKEGVHDALNAIKQDAHPTGEHELWEAYAGPRLGFGASMLVGAGGLPEPGVMAGGFFDVFVAKNLSLSIEFNYSHVGGNNIKTTRTIDGLDNQGKAYHTTEKIKNNVNVGYINTLYCIHWYPWPYRPVSFYTGLQFSRVVNANIREHGGKKMDVKDDVFSGEFAFPIGASYEWKQWSFDARYLISPRRLASAQRTKDVIGSAHNMSLLFSVAYRIEIF